jgi:hypothetical protein
LGKCRDGYFAPQHRQQLGGGWDVLVASRSKEGPRGRGPSLRLAGLPEELGGQEGQCQAFRNTSLQQNSVSTGANAVGEFLIGSVASRFRKSEQTPDQRFISALAL